MLQECAPSPCVIGDSTVHSALYSWPIALVVLGTVPLMAAAGTAVIFANNQAEAITQRA